MSKNNNKGERFYLTPKGKEKAKNLGKQTVGKRGAKGLVFRALLQHQEPVGLKELANKLKVEIHSINAVLSSGIISGYVSTDEHARRLML